MEFELTSKQKRKARRRRQKYEPQWRLYKLLGNILLILAIVFFVVGIYFVEDNDYVLLSVFGVAFALTLVASVSVRALLTNLTSHWLQSRLNERLWVEDGHLFHFVQTPFAAGLNYRHADSRAYLFSMDIPTIREAKYDPQSGRVEFLVNGEGIHFSDIDKQQMDRQWSLNGYRAIFYDCTNPSLVEYLKKYGVQFSETRIGFKIRDASL